METEEGRVDRSALAEAMGRRIAQARREVGFRTAQDLADALDISVWTVRSWESGKSQPRYDMLYTLSQLTGHSQAWFLSEEPLRDKFDITIGELLAKGSAEQDADEAGVYGVSPRDRAAEEALQALSASARDKGFLIRITRPTSAASAEQVAALHLALMGLAGRQE